MKHRGIVVLSASFLFLSLPAWGQTSKAQSKPIDPQNMDFSVQPCDDFYRYANGSWIKNNPIPPAFSSWGSFTELAERNDDVLRGILENAANEKNAPPGSNLQKIGDFYATGMDSTNVENLGWHPIEQDLKRIETIGDVAGVEKEIAYLHTIGAG